MISLNHVLNIVKINKFLSATIATSFINHYPLVFFYMKKKTISRNKQQKQKGTIKNPSTIL
jgi:hypothetical protein